MNDFTSPATRERPIGRFLGRAASIVLLCILVTAPLFAVGPCASGNLSGLIGATCNIGSLQFTFTGLTGNRYIATNSTTRTSTPMGAPWLASDFNFTVLPSVNGFSLSLANPAPQSITGPGGGNNFGTQDSAALLYTVVDLTGNITGESITGGQFTASGTAFGEGLVLGVTSGGIGKNVFSEELLEDAFGLNASYSPGGLCPGAPCTGSNGNPFPSGTGSATIFSLSAENLNTVSWDGTPSTFTFTTQPIPAVKIQFVLNQMMGDGHGDYLLSLVFTNAGNESADTVTLSRAVLGTAPSTFSLTPATFPALFSDSGRTRNLGPVVARRHLHGGRAQLELESKHPFGALACAPVYGRRSNLHGTDEQRSHHRQLGGAGAGNLHAHRCNREREHPGPRRHSGRRWPPDHQWR
jgi:hypothetical protein